MLRSNAKAAAKQSYFGDDAFVTVIATGIIGIKAARAVK